MPVPKEAEESPWSYFTERVGNERLPAFRNTRRIPKFARAASVAALLGIMLASAVVYFATNTGTLTIETTEAARIIVEQGGKQVEVIDRAVASRAVPPITNSHRAKEGAPQALQTQLTVRPTIAAAPSEPKPEHSPIVKPRTSIHKIILVPVPAGTFVMGSPRDDPNRGGINKDESNREQDARLVVSTVAQYTYAAAPTIDGITPPNGSPVGGGTVTTLPSTPSQQSITGEFAVGIDQGSPEVNVYDSTGKLLADFFVYDPPFQGGVHVAVADVNGDGVPDIITGAGAGGGPHVKVIDGSKLTQLLPNGVIKDTALLASFFAYDPSFSGGVTVTAGRFQTGPGLEVVTGTGPGGGPHVRVWSITGGVAAPIVGPLGSFFAYDPLFLGGVTVAAADIEGTGLDDLITGAGAGGGPQVNVYRTNGTLLERFFAYDPSFHGGVNVAAGDLFGTGKAAIITGAGFGGGPQVKVFDGLTLAVEETYFAYDPSFRGGARVGVTNQNGQLDVVAGAGPSGGPEIVILDGLSHAEIENFFAFDQQFRGGVVVGSY